MISIVVSKKQPIKSMNKILRRYCMNGANKLLKEINKKRKAWNERSSFTIMGCRNLSVSDLDTLELYATTYLRTGSVSGLMKPLGPIGEILSKSNIK